MGLLNLFLSLVRNITQIQLRIKTGTEVLYPFQTQQENRVAIAKSSILEGPETLIDEKKGKSVP